MKNWLNKIKNSKLYQKVERHWLTIMFVFGFLGDFLLLNKVDDLFDNLVLFFYVVLAMVSILLLYSSVSGRLPDRINNFFRKFSPMAMQYAFGGLFSGMLIFYGRSASLFDSWPFLLIFGAVIYLNETIKDRSSRLVLTLSMFFVGLFAYVVLVVPVFIGKMGAWVFVGSGLLALLVMYVFLRLLKLIIPNFLALQTRALVFYIGVIFASSNFLYFFNIIPPIPLSLNDIGIYHSVVRFENGEYQLKYEDGKWWEKWKRSDTVFHPDVGDNIFCFARVFAPTKLSLDIYHHWQYYDEAKKEWVTHGRIKYGINGGRDGGYRGYTQISSYQNGQWRCSVETARGQILGREKFEVDNNTSGGELIIRID